MNTAEALFQEHKTCMIPIDAVSERLFGVTPPEFVKMLRSGKLRIKVTQLRDSQKCPILIHVDDLADYIDQIRAREASDHTKLRPPA